MALGINDMTSDTLLLEFSQVRTPIEEARAALCSASCGDQERPSPLFPLTFFLFVFFQPSRKRKIEMDTKGLIKGDMMMSEGERERDLLLFPRASEGAGEPAR